MKLVGILICKVCLLLCRFARWIAVKGDWPECLNEANQLRRKTYEYLAELRKP